MPFMYSMRKLLLPYVCLLKWWTNVVFCSTCGKAFENAKGIFPVCRLCDILPSSLMSIEVVNVIGSTRKKHHKCILVFGKYLRPREYHRFIVKWTIFQVAEINKFTLFEPNNYVSAAKIVVPYNNKSIVKIISGYSSCMQCL